MSALTPEQVYEEFRCAELALELGQPLDAVRLLDPVVEAAPTSTAALELLARALFASAQLTRAEEALHQLVERRPDDGWARFALARTLERQGRKDEAALQRRLAAALGLST
jgi:Flp pilus assembly protein TadD